jgi:hypothetical protein
MNVNISTTGMPRRPRITSAKTGEALHVRAADVRMRCNEVVTATLQIYVGDVQLDGVTAELTTVLPDGHTYRLVRVDDAKGTRAS